MKDSAAREQIERLNERVKSLELFLSIETARNQHCHIRYNPLNLEHLAFYPIRVLKSQVEQIYKFLKVSQVHYPEKTVLEKVKE